MELNEIYTIKQFSDIFEIPKSRVYYYIKTGKLNCEKIHSKISIIRDENHSNIISELIQNKIYYGIDEPYVPNELMDYENWHQTIDYMSWLLKVTYSEPNKIKNKHFNIRYIFENYIDKNQIITSVLKKEFGNKNLKTKEIIDDLKRGWYNELSFIYPLKNSTLGVSFKDISENLDVSSIRFQFPSWKITEYYYSSYFYFRAISQFKNSTFRIQEHKATQNTFKNNALNSLKKNLWKFPFNIEYFPSKRFYAKKLTVDRHKHLEYKYSYHPRAPHLSPLEITKEIHSLFRKRGKSFSKPTHYTYFDYILEFRIWANYLDIDNLLSLYGSGYKAFLDQNLSLILFIVGGITELICISVFGEEKYLIELQNMYDLFAKNNKEIKDNFIYTSLFQRMKIYKLKGIISREIDIESIINENEIN